MWKKRRTWIAISGVALAMLFTLWFFNRGSKAPEVLASATVSLGTVRTSLEATGIIKSEVGASVKTGSRFTGIIRQLYVKVGDKVSRDQIIAEIDDREQTAQRDEAQATVHMAQAELERILASYPLQINEARAQLNATRAEAEYAELLRSRRQNLVDRDLEARNVLDEAAQKAATAHATMQAREATLRRLEGDFVAEAKRARQALAQAEASLTSANIRLSYAIIRSPMDGVVSEVTAQEGETVVAGFQVVNLITILDPTRLEMWIYVDETDIAQVHPGMQVEFKVDSLAGKTFNGQVDQVYPEPELRDNIVYYQALVRLDPASAALLRPEMTTQCRIIVSTKKDVLCIPNAAVKWVDGRKVVYVLDGSTVETREPVLGMVGAENTEVLSGLETGQTVVTKIVLPATQQRQSMGRH